MAIGLFFVGGNVHIGNIWFPLGGMGASYLQTCPFLYWMMVLPVPLLWFFWRKTVSIQTPRHRIRFWTVCLLPLPAWGVPFLRTLQLEKMGALWEEVAEVNLYGSYTEYRPTAAASEVLSWFYDYSLPVLAVVLVLTLIWAWRESPWYLVPAAHALGAMTAELKFWEIVLGLFPSGNDGPNIMLEDSLLIYLGVAIGGSLLTVLLLKKGVAWEDRLKSAVPVSTVREEQERNRMLAVFFLWPMLTTWFTRGWEPLFDWSFFLRFLVAVGMIPMLGLLWRNRPENVPLEQNTRQKFGLFTILPFLVELLFIGVVFWWFMGGIAQGRTFRYAVMALLYPVACLVMAGSMLLCLTQAWMGVPCFLCPASHCAGVLASMGTWCETIFTTHADESLRFGNLAAPALLAYALGFVGALLTLGVLQKRTPRPVKTS